DHKQCNVGIFERALGLSPHSAGEGIGRRFLETGGVDHPKAEICEMAVALPPVAGNAWQVIDKRQLPADEPVEQGRFADIRPADRMGSDFAFSSSNRRSWRTHRTFPASRVRQRSSLSLASTNT